MKIIAKITAFFAGAAAFIGVLFSLFKGAEAQKNIKAMKKLGRDFDKIEQKRKEDKRTDEEVLKGGVK